MNLPIEELINKLPEGSRKAIVALIGIGGIVAAEVPPELLKWKLVAIAGITVVCVVCQTALDWRASAPSTT